MVDYNEAVIDAIKAEVQGGYHKDDEYNTGYSLDPSQVLFSAIELIAKPGEDKSKIANGLDIRILIMPKAISSSSKTQQEIEDEVSTKLARDVHDILSESNNKPTYLVVHDAERGHYTSIIIDQNKDGKKVAFGFDGLGKFFSEENEGRSFNLQQRVALIMVEKGALFYDKSEKVQVDNCCGLTVASVIADYQGNRGQYLAEPEGHKAGNKLLKHNTIDKLKGWYKELGEKIFCAIEAVRGGDKPLTQSMVRKEDLAWRNIAKEMKISGDLSVADIKKAQEAFDSEFARKLMQQQEGENAKQIKADAELAMKIAGEGASGRDVVKGQEERWKEWVEFKSNGSGGRSV